MEQTFERLHKQIEDIGTLLKSKEIYGEELILSKIYSYVKSISGEYYDGKEMSPDYRFIRMAIDRAEGTTFGKILNVPVEFTAQNIIDFSVSVPLESCIIKLKS